MSEESFLNAVFSIPGLAPDEKATIVDSFNKVEFKRHDFLFTEGQVLNNYYFLETGFVRSFVNDFNGNEVTTGFYAEKSIVLDWTSFRLRAPTQENFQATADCSCWALKFDAFQILFNSIEKFRESGRARFARNYLKLKTHHLSLLSKTAKERYTFLLENNPEIIENASLKHIATYLGITDTSLSRIRNEIVP